MHLRSSSPMSWMSLGAMFVALTGCAGHSDLMAKAPPAYAAPPSPSSATIVFFRDSGIAHAVNFAILDHSANFIGDAVARSDFSVQVPPGRYFLVAKGGEGSDAVQAEVAAGHIYYVRVIPHLGMWLARVELDPIKPGEEGWQRLSSWLTQTNHLIPRVPRVPVSLSASPVPEWVAEVWDELSAEERASRTLIPTDGLALPSSRAVVASPPLAAADPR